VAVPAGVVDDLGEAKVGDLHVPALVEEDIARLEIVVDDDALVARKRRWVGG